MSKILKYTVVVRFYLIEFQEETSSSQSQSQRVYLQQKFTADKLYKVSQSYLATDLMDLSLNAGDLVGVIQEKDPMGNRDRWFVDNGGEGWPQIISDVIK